MTGVQTCALPIFVDGIPLEASSYEANWEIRRTDVSTGATNGTRYAMVRPDPKLTIRMPIDDENSLEVCGYTLGDVIPILYCRTSSTTADKLEHALVVSMPKTVNTENDVPRVVVMLEGGDLTLDVTYPT